MMKTFRRIIFLIGILGAAALACQTAGGLLGGPTFVPTFAGDVPATAVPTLAIAPTSPPAEAVSTDIPADTAVMNTPPPEEQPAALFTDDFSDIDSGWVRILTNEGGADYSDGGYLIFIHKENHLLWATSRQQFTNVRVQVNARLVGGELDNNYGVICRYQDDNNFYTLVISSDGYFSIRKRVGGGALETIIGDSFQFSDQIRLGEQENTLMAECAGDQLRLYVNGVKIAETTDASFSSGDVGLLAGTFSATSAEILFDDFIAQEIE